MQADRRKYFGSGRSVLEKKMKLRVCVHESYDNRQEICQHLCVRSFGGQKIIYATLGKHLKVPNRPPAPSFGTFRTKMSCFAKKSTFKGQKHDFNSLHPLYRNLGFALPAICDFISSSWKWTFIWGNIFCVFHSCYLFLPTAALYYANRGDEVTHTSEPMTAGMWEGSSASSSSFFSSSSMFSSSSPPPVVGGNYSPHQHPTIPATEQCEVLVKKGKNSCHSGSDWLHALQLNG